MNALQIAAGALGQGPDADGEENSAARAALGCAAAVKAEAFFHLTANISYPLMVLLSMILLPAMIVRFYQGWFQMLVIDLPLFLASTCSISSFYLAAERALYPKNVEADISLSAVCDGRGHRASRCATR